MQHYTMPLTHMGIFPILLISESKCNIYRNLKLAYDVEEELW